MEFLSQSHFLPQYDTILTTYDWLFYWIGQVWHPYSILIVLTSLFCCSVFVWISHWLPQSAIKNWSSFLSTKQFLKNTHFYFLAGGGIKERLKVIPVLYCTGFLISECQTQQPKYSWFLCRLTITMLWSHH